MSNVNADSETGRGTVMKMEVLLTDRDTWVDTDTEPDGGDDDGQDDGLFQVDAD
jgi:hypothetical protein